MDRSQFKRGESRQRLMSCGQGTLLLVGLTMALAACASHAEPAAGGRPDAGSASGHGPTQQPTAASSTCDAASDARSSELPLAAADGGSVAVSDGGAAEPVDAGSSGDEVVPAEPDIPPAVDHGSSEACPVGAMREVGLDEQTSLGTPRALRDAFVQATEALDPRETPFRWSTRFGGTTTVAIGAIEWGDATYMEIDQPGCEDLRISAAIRLTTQDGKLDEMAQGWVRGTQFSGSFEQSGALSEWLVDHAARPGLEITSLSVVFSVADSHTLVGELNATTDLDDYELASDLYGLGKFDSAWVRGVDLDAPFQRAAPIDDACAAAEPADVSASFSPGIADLSGKLSKVWLRCSGASTGFPAHDGIAISGTGWRHISYRDGAWTEQTGFGHEGAVEILDTSINGPGSQQVAFWDMLPFTFASPSVDMSSSATSLQLALGGRGSLGFDGLYVASDATVGAAALAYADGERAGAAACDKGEAHVHRAGSAADVSTALAGKWIFCSGSFRPDATGIEFTALGTYNHLAADGGTVASGLYQVIDTGDFNGAGSSQINLNDLDGGRHTMSVLLQSDAPVKLTFGLNGDGRGVLSAQ
jgi:hypothetical protein